MSFYFIANNIHFALEVLGALSFIMVGWLAWDSYLLRKDWTTSSRAVGFSLLAVWQIIHAMGLAGDFIFYLGYIFFFTGLGFVIWNLILEKPASRPTFSAVLLIPAAAAVVPYFNLIATLSLITIAYLSYQQYKKEMKTSLWPFVFGFIAIAAGYFLGIFYDQESLNAFWAIGHVLEFVGFASLVWWVWRYLQLRVGEEIIFIFISAAILISIVVTLAFSTILIAQIESAVRVNLSTNVKVLDYTFSHLKEEALAKAKILSTSTDVRSAILRNRFNDLGAIATRFFNNEKLGFLTILDNGGRVLIRASAPSQKSDNLSKEKAVRDSLAGKSVVFVESSPSEKFSIRAASPVFYQGEVVGVVLVGFLLDNAFLDGMKKITGLEISVFENNAIVSSTLLSADGQTRVSGVKQTDAAVSEAMKRGEIITLRTEFLSRPFLASYLPILNSDGEVAGMLSAAKPQREILETANATNHLTLVAVTIIVLMSIAPIYFLTKKLTEEIKS